MHFKGPVLISESSLPWQWYALHVRSRHEKSVLAQLEVKQCDAFLPLYQTKHRWADRWKTVSLPLFPGYVFCRFDAAARSSVLATSGVIDIIRSGGEPAPIDSSEIEAIQVVLRTPLQVEPYPSLVAGQRVTVDGGPLKGLSGTLLEIRNSVRLVISVELLRRSVLVEIEREWASPANAPAGIRKHASAVYAGAGTITKESRI